MKSGRCATLERRPEQTTGTLAAKTNKKRAAAAPLHDRIAKKRRRNQGSSPAKGAMLDRKENTRWRTYRQKARARLHERAKKDAPQAPKRDPNEQVGSAEAGDSEGFRRPHSTDAGRRSANRKGAPRPGTRRVSGGLTARMQAGDKPVDQQPSPPSGPRRHERPWPGALPDEVLGK